MTTTTRKSEDLQRRARRGTRRAWHGITEGIELQELWTQFKSDARQSYGLYSEELDWQTVATIPQWKRPWAVTRLLFWVLLHKLTPARRLFLVATLVVAGCAVFDVRLFGLPRPVQLIIAFLGLIVLLALELSDRVTMKRDLEIARDIQSWLLPEAPPVVPGHEIAFSTRPANTVGGDYYDAFYRKTSADDGPLLLVVADVAGKSVPAALLMARFQASLRTLAAGPASFEELVKRLNQQVCANSLGGRRFTTAFLGELWPRERRLTYVCAGHPPALLVRSGGLQKLDCGGLPFGVDASAPYEADSVRLEPDDLLIVYTDGVCDATNAQDEDFGEPRLLQGLDDLRGKGVESVRDVLTRRVDTFVGGARQVDDMTWLLARTYPS